VEIQRDLIIMVWADSKRVLRRDDVETYKVRARRSVVEGAFGAFIAWSPVNAHALIVLRKPVWFAFLGVAGLWRAEAVPLEVRDLKGFTVALDRWLGQGNDTTPPDGRSSGSD
jgi:hypothetical protein